MNLFSRHKNTVALATLLLIQLLALAVQVKKQTVAGPVRIIRLVTVDTVATFERAMMHTGSGVRGVWWNYLDLRHVRRENLRLKAENDQLLLERAREQEELRQAHRVEALLNFKQNWIDSTVAAQVIGTSGMETSRLLYLDKGASDGIRPDMPVITPDGVVGKVLNVFGNTSQVLMIDDPSSGVGAILVKSRLQGIVRGTPTGRVELKFIMSDESVQPGESLVTSGGDRIFPKGLPIGTVSHVSVGRDLFLDIQLKPAADLDRLEEVLVITQQKPRSPEVSGPEPVRASDILAEHLPGIPVQAAADATAKPAGSAEAKPASPTAGPKPASDATKTQAKPPRAAKPATTTNTMPATTATAKAATTAAPKTGAAKPGATAAVPKNAAAKPGAAAGQAAKAAATPDASAHKPMKPAKPSVASAGGDRLQRQPASNEGTR